MKLEDKDLCDICETLPSEKQKENRVPVIEKQTQSLVSTPSKLKEKGQVDAVARTQYTSGRLRCLLFPSQIL
jgi:hypothetical protein